MSSSSGQQSIVQGSMFPSPRESDTLADTKRGSAPASPGKNTTTNGTAPTNTGEAKYAARDGGVSSHYMRGCTVFLVRAAKTPATQIGGVDVVDEVYVVPNHSTTHQSSRSCTPTEEDHDKCLETLRWNATTAMFGTCLQEEFEARLEDVMNYRVSEVPAEALHGVLRLGGVSILLIVTKLLSVAGGIQFPDFGEIYEVGGLSYVMLPTSGTPPNYNNNNNGAPTPTLRPRGTPSSHPAGRPSDADLKHYLTIVERYCSVSTHCGAKGLYISFNADISVPVAAHPGGKISSPLSSLLHHPDQQRSMESMGEIMLPESTNSLTSTPDGSSYPSTKTATKSALSSGSGGGGSRGSKYRNIFSWNANLCIGAFPDNRYTPPTMRGFVEGASVPCSGSGSDSAPIMVALFSRQSAKYAGTRYNRRGLSKDGIPANFVESEQLMWCGSFDKGGRPMPDEAGSYPSVSSYTVFRGSVPVDWSQRADLTSKPQTVVHDNPHVAFADHMRILDQLYPQHHIGCINLMTAKGIEAKLTDIFNTVAADYNADIAANVSDFGSNGTSTINNGRSTPQKCRSPMSKPTSAAVSPMLNANFGGGSGSNHHHHHAPRLVSYLHYNLGDRLHDKKSFTEIQSEMIALLSEVILDNTKQPPTTTTTTTATVASPAVSTAPMSYADVVGKKKAVSSLPASAASASTEHQQSKLPLLTVDSWKYRISKGSTNTPLALCKSPSFGSSSMRLVVDRRGHQHSIVRVNCLDCLDRTNVAQSMLATAVLEQQLEALGFEVADANAAATLSVVSDRIKTLWVNHGHRISMLYAGSNAHFSDIIRTGHATPKTFANPYPMAPIALRRFKLQNFYDGQKQDCISLVTGHHVPSPSRDPDQSTLHRPEVPNTIIKCSLLCVTALFFMLIFDHLYMNKGAFTTEICFGYASFMVMVGVMGRTAITRRKALVVNPLLR